MAGTKRPKDPFDVSYDRPSKSKRVQFAEKPKKEDPDFEIDHEDSLESARQRRGAVIEVEGSDDEEVGGGIYSSDSDDDSDQDINGKADKSKDGDTDMDMFSEEPVKKSRHLKVQDIEGQELDSKNIDSDDSDDSVEPNQTKIMAFNMKDEMEEGNFNQEGTYVRKKADQEAFHDKWMEGISRKEIKRAREAQEKRELYEARNEVNRLSNIPQTEAETFLALLKLLSPEESVREALTKLGTASRKIPAWKQKLMAKKKTQTAKALPQISDEEEAALKAKVERITELADQLMGRKHLGIYEYTYERIIRHLRTSNAISDDWTPSFLSD